MKKFLFTLLLAMTSVAVGAQTGRAYMNKHGGSIVAFTKSTIDSITDSNAGTNTITPGEAIDLGLSVKWANCNVGATSPEGFGGYYAWGETEEKSDYTWDTYKYHDLSTRHCIDIGSNISGTQYDVAHVKWGGNWRMPTHEEMQELYDKCTYKWIAYNGVNGDKFTGPNGNSIFLPAADDRGGTEVDTKGILGFYWSSSIYSDFKEFSWLLYFFKNGANRGSGHTRYRGFSERPVTK